MHLLVTSIRVAELKNQPIGLAMGRLQSARQVGAVCLDVLNRGRPILHLGLADDLPQRWRGANLRTLPLTDLKRSRASLLALRKEGEAVLLTQKKGPTLALWPLEETYSRAPELTIMERFEYYERELKRLRAEVSSVKQEFNNFRKDRQEVVNLEYRLLESTDEAKAVGKRKVKKPSPS
jgi:hypothetical protein